MLTREQLIEKKEAFKTRYQELAVELSKLEISKNRHHYKRHTIDDVLIRRRDLLAKEFTELRDKITDINKLIKPLTPKEDYFKMVIKDSVSEAVYNDICKECENREKGGSAFKVKLSDNTGLLKQVKGLNDALKAKDAIIVAARAALNEYINDNMNGNKADFLKSIDKLNKSLPKNH